MRILFDKVKTLAVIQALNRTTKATITLFDCNLKCIADAGKWQPYCLAVGEREDLLAKCGKCNYEHTQEALSQHKIIKYTCHANIMEIVAPIFWDDEIIAYLMLGKIRDNEGVFSSEEGVRQFAEENRLDVDEMLSKYRQLPLLSAQDIEDYVMFTDLVIQYVATHCLIHKTEKADALEKYIENHISEKLTAQILCKEFYISKKALYLLVRENFNMDLHDLITRKKIAIARKELAETSKSVEDIAIDAGYGNYKYFSVVFKNTVGMTPIEYRKKNS